MELSRRQCLHWALMAGAGALTGCVTPLQRLYAPPPAITPKDLHDYRRLCLWLNRVTFGATLTELERLSELGQIAYLEQQLHPNEQSEPWAVRLRLRGFDIFRYHPAEMGDLPIPEVLRQLQQHAILRATYSRFQLFERMVDFWRDHFNVYALKGQCAYYLPQFERDVLRKHAFGKFVHLLKATARSPAMLYYLDNYRNRRGTPNENYARELLELHTLGVKGGYHQRDVQEVARCFTGWTVEERFLHPKGRFRFDPSQHDDGEKQVLNHRIPAGGGERDGDLICEILAAHPSTARHLCTKLCRYFMGQAPQHVVQRLSQVYLQTGGDLSEVLRELLLSAELVQTPPIMKRPFDYMVSALRALQALTDANRPLQKHLLRMGQPLYQWSLPDGYPLEAEAWKGTLLARWNFAIAVTSNAIPGTRVDIANLVDSTRRTEPVDALLQALFCRAPNDPELVPLRNKLMNKTTQHSATPQVLAALLLASPQFQWR